MNEPVWPSADKGVTEVAGKHREGPWLDSTSALGPFFFKKVVVCGYCPSCDFVPHVIKMALIAAHCNGRSHSGMSVSWVARDMPSVLISPPLLPFFPHLHNLTPPPPPPPSLISLMVSVDIIIIIITIIIIIIHSFYIGAILCSRADSMRTCRMWLWMSDCILFIARIINTPPRKWCSGSALWLINTMFTNTCVYS